MCRHLSDEGRAIAMTFTYWNLVFSKYIKMKWQGVDGSIQKWKIIPYMQFNFRIAKGCWGCENLDNNACVGAKRGCGGTMQY